MHASEARVHGLPRSLGDVFFRLCLQGQVQYQGLFRASSNHIDTAQFPSLTNAKAGTSGMYIGLVFSTSNCGDYRRQAFLHLRHTGRGT
jgi:hypothetical protein